jgi:kynurenine formamidase
VHKSIENGDSSNSSMISLSSHAGTHIDLPRHFCQNQESVQDLLEGSNYFFPTYCISCKKEAGEVITAKDIFPILPKISDAQALLLRTGFSSLREENPEIYINTHPSLDPRIADLLRKHCKNLRLIGIDIISVSLPGQRELGQRCHRSFLCGDKPILLLEDVFIPENKTQYLPLTLSIYPFLVDNLDGVPVIAFLEDLTS